MPVWRVMWVFAALVAGACACGRIDTWGEDQVESLRIRPEVLSLYPGLRVALSVDGLLLEEYGEGYRRKTVSLNDRPELLVWTASSRVARVEKGPVLQAVAAGKTRLLANFEGRQAETPVEVTAHLPYRIDARPDTLELQLGAYRQLAVQGTLTDGSELDLGQPAYGTVYSSADPTIASVTAEGIVFGQADGRTEIIARHGEFFDRVAVVSGSGRSLYAIELVPQRLDLLVGESARLQLRGRFTDQTVEDLTSHPLTHLLIEDAGVASLQAGGLVVALGDGQTTVRARHKDFSSSAEVAVHEPKLLVDLQVSPAWLALRRGDVAQLAVQAVFLGGDFQDVTGRSEFVSADPDIAGVSSGGLVTAVAAGRTSVRVSFGGRVGVCALAVEQAGCWLRLHPAASLLQPGEQLSLQVFFGQPGLPDQEVTSEAIFQSTSPAVAPVDASGRVEALASGLASVLASWQGLEGASQISVREP